MEGVSVVVTISYALDGTEFFAIDLGEATRETFSWGSDKTKVEVVFLSVLITAFTHMSDDVET